MTQQPYETNTRLAQAIGGSFYRREKGHRYPLNDPKHQDAILYHVIKWSQDGVLHRDTVCCNTSNMREAAAWLKKYKHEIPMGPYEKFLKAQILRGKRAEKELIRLLAGKKK